VNKVFTAAALPLGARRVLSTPLLIRGSGRKSRRTVRARDPRRSPDAVVYPRRWLPRGSSGWCRSSRVRSRCSGPGRSASLFRFGRTPSAGFDRVDTHRPSVKVHKGYPAVFAREGRLRRTHLNHQHQHQQPTATKAAPATAASTPKGFVLVIFFSFSPTGRAKKVRPASSCCSCSRLELEEVAALTHIVIRFDSQAVPSLWRSRATAF
jgi:hypothetical protein